MKATASIITVAVLASVFAIPVPVESSQFEHREYGSKLKELDEITKELKQIEKEVDSKLISKTLSYKKTLVDLQKENNSLRKDINKLPDTIIVIDTVVIKENRSFWGKTKTDTLK